MKQSSCRNPVRHIWQSCGVVLQMLLLMSLLSPHPGKAVEAAAPAVQPAWPLEITTAEFALDPNGPWQSLQLPDTWADRQLKGSRTAYYRISFNLVARPDAPLAMKLDRLSLSHEIRLNGHLLQGHPDSALTKSRRPFPARVMLPAALLVTGPNLLELTVNAGSRAGLSPLIIGDQTSIDEAFESLIFRHMQFPVFLNIATISVALFLVILWSKRRSDTALGVIAFLSLLASLRNLSYFMGSPLASQALADWAFFSAQCISAVMLCVLSMHHAGVKSPVLNRVLVAVVAVYTILGALASATGHIQAARAVLYPGLLVLVVVAMTLLIRQATKRRSVSDVLIALSMIIVIGAGIHDYLHQTGYTSIMDTFWIPYATPVVLLAYLGTLSYRLIDALNTRDQLAQILEAKVAERTAELETSNQAKSRYLAAASHDLRQPLVSIGLLSVLLREQALPPAALSFVTRLQSAVENMESLFNRVLDFARLDAKAIQPNLQAIAVQPLLAAIAPHMQEVANQKDLRLRFRPTDAGVIADPLMLEQILRNLISNALRYTARGSVLVSVRPALPDGWRIEVRDSGPGIANTDQGQIFDEFVRLPRSSSKLGASDQPGLGLGLAISRRLARLMGTDLRLRSALGRGSCFSLRLQAAVDAGKPAETKRSA